MEMENAPVQVSAVVDVKDESRAPSPPLVPSGGPLNHDAAVFKMQPAAVAAQEFVLSTDDFEAVREECLKAIELVEHQEVELQQMLLANKRKKAAVKELEDAIQETDNEYVRKSTEFRDNVNACAILNKGLRMIEKSDADKAAAVAEQERKTREQEAIHAEKIARWQRIQQEQAKLQQEEAELLKAINVRYAAA